MGLQVGLNQPCQPGSGKLATDDKAALNGVRMMARADITAGKRHCRTQLLVTTQQCQDLLQALCDRHPAQQRLRHATVHAAVDAAAA